MLLRYTCIRTSALFWLWLLVAGFSVHVADVSAQGLSLQQRILMPGPLNQQHAEYESTCENCHSPFEREEMTSLCLGCHEDVAEDRLMALGFHGQYPLAADNPCESCHTDHEGRDYDITGLLPDTFDHSTTRFALQGAHADQACSSCHETDQAYRSAATACLDCHLDQDIHNGSLGESCDDCHRSQSWQQLLSFDHEVTDFPLEGMHTEVACASCHLGQQYQFEETGCVTCHSTTDVHGGAYGDNCEGCHTVQGWEEVTFDHGNTSFPLEGAHENTPCVSCHSEDQLRESAVSSELLQSQFPDSLAALAATGGTATSGESRACIDCHGDDDLHFGRNGSDCESCHTATQWQDSIFDHNSDTGYLLTDAHAEAECTQCHTGAIDDPLAQECVTCHLGDDVHQDSGMQNCESCHTPESWDASHDFDHDFTAFPLLGMHLIVPCESCHVDNQMTRVENDCVSCHATDDFHQESVGQNCSDCHNPNAWELWQFDHATQTDFVLTGSHDGLACDACHLPNTEPELTPDSCGSCHLTEDVHRGEFGQSCDQCHNTSSFTEVSVTGRRL